MPWPFSAAREIELMPYEPVGPVRFDPNEGDVAGHVKQADSTATGRARVERISRGPDIARVHAVCHALGLLVVWIEHSTQVDVVAYRLHVYR